MKLSTQKQFEGASDLRFNALVKQQTLEHKHLIEGHQKEMQELRDALHLATQKFNSISERNDQEMRDLRAQAIDAINFLKIKVLASESTIEQQKKIITDLHKHMMDLHSLCTSKIETEKLQSSIEEKMKESANRHVLLVSEAQRGFNVLFASLKDEIMKLRSETNLKLGQERDQAAEEFALARIDKEGALKELERYKKDMFIIEKKIENIYTLIERLNQRGEACPKQA